MILFLLPLLITAASGVKLIEKWECGSEAVWGSTFISDTALTGCHDAVRNGTNLCCKLHDWCYDVSKPKNYSRGYCDTSFCNCLQDVSDKTNEDGCKNSLQLFCSAVEDRGVDAYNTATPNDLDDKFVEFEDGRPFGLNMKRLVDTCHFSKGVAVHCHNSAMLCLGKPHEREKREEAMVEHSYEDCRSTVYDCLQMIVDGGASENCTAIALSIAKQVLVYNELDEAKHGKSIIDAYPVIASRLLKQCNESTGPLETCFLSFDACAQQNHEERPEVYNAARRIKIVCHQDLRRCVNETTKDSTIEDCLEARALAISLIRDVEFVPEKSFGAAAYDAGSERGWSALVALEAYGQRVYDSLPNNPFW